MDIATAAVGESDKPPGEPYPDLILIDDDWIIREVWKLSAEEQNLELLCFGSPEEFDKKSATFLKNTPVFIDVCLDADKRDEQPSGDEFARILKDRGFSNIWLATSFPESHFKSIDWISGVTGKDFPGHLF